MDALRVFRKCFYCKGRSHLLQTVHPGYNTTYDYYHKDCLEHVLENPEVLVKYLDTAIQISDQIESDRQKEQTKRNIEAQNIRRANELLLNQRLQSTSPSQPLSLSTVEVPEGIMRVPISTNSLTLANLDRLHELQKLAAKREIKEETEATNNKFRKLFKQ
jgi:hypothetical protein